MAIDNFATPPLFASAYKPLLWRFTSDHYPNSIAGENNVAITSIELADAAAVLLYGGTLAIGDIFIVHAATTLGTWPVGQAIYITNTTAGYYNGIHHVVKEVSTTITVIDAAYLGDDAAGTIDKYYEGYGLVVNVTMQNLGEVKRKTVNSDLIGSFEADLSDIAQRSFADVFDKAAPDAETIPVTQDAGAIAQSYSITVQEAFMVPDADGLNNYVVSEVIAFTSEVQYVVNSVQPYHHINAIAGKPDLLWEDDLSAYVADASLAVLSRFLTYAPRGWQDNDYHHETAMGIAPDDNYWLSFLLLKTDPDSILEMSIRAYDADGVILSGSDTELVTPFGPITGAITIGVGPKNLGALLDPDAHHYTIAIRKAETGGGVYITETFAFALDRTCHRNPTRFYWLNPFGAIDAFTFSEGGPRRTATKRTTIAKPQMKAFLNEAGTRGDWQRRVIAVEIDRIYRASTRPLRHFTVTYLAEDLYESANIRVFVYAPGEEGFTAWTWVIPVSSEVKISEKSGALEFNYQLGIDEGKQRT